MTRYLSSRWIERYHEELMLEQDHPGPLMGEEAAARLESAVLRPAAEAFGEEAYATLATKAAVLLQGIVIAHPFTDGNKRAGLGAMLSLLELNGIALDTDEDELYDFVIAVTTGELREVDEMAAEVRRLFRFP